MVRPGSRRAPHLTPARLPGVDVCHSRQQDTTSHSTTLVILVPNRKGGAHRAIQETPYSPISRLLRQSTEPARSYRRMAYSAHPLVAVAIVRGNWLWRLPSWSRRRRNAASAMPRRRQERSSGQPALGERSDRPLRLRRDRERASRGGRGRVVGWRPLAVTGPRLPLGVTIASLAGRRCGRRRPKSLARDGAAAGGVR